MIKIKEIVKAVFRVVKLVIKINAYLVMWDTLLQGNSVYNVVNLTKIVQNAMTYTAVRRVDLVVT